MSEERRAFDFLKQAQKKVKGWSLFGNKYEKAVELFESAGNLFKVAENCACLCV